MNGDVWGPKLLCEKHLLSLCSPSLHLSEVTWTHLHQEGLSASLPRIGSSGVHCHDSLVDIPFP